MLASKNFPEILHSILTDGVDGAIILTTEGSILSSEFLAFPGNGDFTETSFAAIISSIWFNYLQGATTEVICFLTQLDNAIIAIAPIGKSYIVAAVGTNVSLGLLRGRVEALSQYFNKIFEQVK